MDLSHRALITCLVALWSPFSFLWTEETCVVKNKENILGHGLDLSLLTPWFWVVPVFIRMPPITSISYPIQTHLLLVTEHLQGVFSPHSLIQSSGGVHTLEWPCLSFFPRPIVALSLPLTVKQQLSRSSSEEMRAEVFFECFWMKAVN